MTTDMTIGVKDATVEQARKAKLRHAFYLARLACDEMVNDSPRGAVLYKLLLHGSDFPPDGINPKSILVTLANAWQITPKTRLSDFSAIEISKLTHELRNFLREAGIAIPPVGRRREQAELDAPASRQTLAVVYDLVAQLDWSAKRLEAFIVRRRLCGGRRMIHTERDARAVLYGLKGILRHNSGQVIRHQGKEKR